MGPRRIGRDGSDLLEPSKIISLKTVKDLQEVDVVTPLRFVLAQHRQAQAQWTTSDTMQVDSPMSQLSRFSASISSSILELVKVTSLNSTSLIPPSPPPLPRGPYTPSHPLPSASPSGPISHVDDVMYPRAKGEKENCPYADIPVMLQISAFLQHPPRQHVPNTHGDASRIPSIQEVQGVCGCRTDGAKSGHGPRAPVIIM
ncbi:hypothetical protein BDP27DRAFT_1434123 [Rhodocollybia butyracea]|uniref:Uncharacterized protein n=1 Tax=Rhodocollybia butyracea TaxID=206335 RepID=A0A9P5P6H1_9AGAR|nr:hypothetical protein BDP27DRAFT_1434123 [Rhodocollybia butyracea]